MWDVYMADQCIQNGEVGTVHGRTLERVVKVFD